MIIIKGSNIPSPVPNQRALQVAQDFFAKWVAASGSDTVDGSELRQTEVEGKVVEIPVFTRFGIHLKWLFGISEPSTVVSKFDTGWKPY